MSTFNELCFGIWATHEEHDQSMKQVIDKMESTTVTLNVVKLKFSQDTLKFLWHFIDKNCI